MMLSSNKFLKLVQQLNVLLFLALAKLISSVFNQEFMHHLEVQTHNLTGVYFQLPCLIHTELPLCQAAIKGKGHFRAILYILPNQTASNLKMIVNKWITGHEKSIKSVYSIIQTRVTPFQQEFCPVKVQFFHYTSVSAFTMANLYRQE